MRNKQVTVSWRSLVFPTVSCRRQQTESPVAEPSIPTHRFLADYAACSWVGTVAAQVVKEAVGETDRRSDGATKPRIIDGGRVCPVP
jgi:hypothetical protein